MKYSYFIRPYSHLNKDFQEFLEKPFDSYEAVIWALKDAGFDIVDESIAWSPHHKIEITVIGKDLEGNSIGALPTIYLYY